MKSKKEIDRDYYSSHRKKALERVANYYQRNKDKISAYKKEWYKKEVKMKYKDNKWKIMQDKKGLRIYIKCECGLKHDISLDKKGFIGRGTEILKS